MRLNVAAERLCELAGLLDGSERARANRYRFAPDRDRFVARRGLLRERLGAILGEAPQRLRFDYEADGKPGLADHPLRFSVSSAGDWMMLAAGEVEIGCDIAALDPAIEWRGIADALYAPEERAADAAAFFRIWTRKEAVLKAVGTGFGLAPETFSTHEHALALGGSEWVLHDVAAPFGHIAAVAIARTRPSTGTVGRNAPTQLSDFPARIPS